MKDILFAAAALLAALSVLCGTSDRAPAQPTIEGRLVEFQSKDGKFRILLPGEPEKEVVEVGNAKEKQYQFKLGTAAGAYIVSYQDNPNLEGSTDKQVAAALDTGRDSLVRLFQGKLITSKSVPLEKKHPGLDFRVTIPQADGEARCRFYMVGTRLYQILVVGLPEFANSQEATRVIDSFKVL